MESNLNKTIRMFQYSQKALKIQKNMKMKVRKKQKKNKIKDQQLNKMSLSEKPIMQMNS
jgi:hypothetical protein